MPRVSISLTELSETVWLCFPAVPGEQHILDFLQRGAGSNHSCCLEPSLGFDRPCRQSGGNCLAMTFKTEERLLGQQAQPLTSLFINKLCREKDTLPLPLRTPCASLQLISPLWLFILSQKRSVLYLHQMSIARI